MEINRPFLGNALNAVDAKGRVSVPSGFRELIVARCRGKDESFSDKRVSVMLHAQCDRLVVYDDVGVEKLSAALTASVQDLPWADRMQKADELGEELGNMQVLTFDGAGRIVIPESLRGPLGIKDQALFWGGLNSFEIWDPAKARVAFADNPRKRMTLEGLFSAKERS